MTRWVGVMALLVAAPVMAEPAATAPPTAPPYEVKFAPPSGVPHGGWGLYAAMHGRSMDVGAGDLGWTDDSRVQRGDVEAGYGWRGDSTTAVVGYIQHDQGPTYVGPKPPNDTPNSRRFGNSGVIGMGFVLHAR